MIFKINVHIYHYCYEKKKKKIGLKYSVTNITCTPVEVMTTTSLTPSPVRSAYLIPRMGADTGLCQDKLQLPESSWV